ncbi:hypothetical protein OBV_40300 [Oscillibacter valericigenes Sjm18-20]|nr:hypothetical protein OBV_40300 [Oscillibacter valericigenes Sjm18-20]
MQKEELRPIERVPDSFDKLDGASSCLKDFLNCTANRTAVVHTASVFATGSAKNTAKALF